MSKLRRLLLPAALALVLAARADVLIDATTPPAPATPLSFAVGGQSPTGETLEVNRRFFTRNGQPWFPVMGEFHFARYPEAEWEGELRKMKAGGIDVVGTYVFWNFHEERPGRFDWSGQRNLRKFVETCGRVGLQVWIRIGPWCHGEVRNGGLPDWVLAAGPVRQNAPGYLELVQRFFAQIGAQVRGQFWQDGGPIIGVQLENEYHPDRDGEAHMLRLLEIARAAGCVAPFYSATGWDKAVIPAAPFLPVFGGYTEQFWSDSLTELPPNQHFFFTTIRAEDNVGYLLEPKDRTYHERYLGYPFLTAELGGGMAVAYHRRPVMYAADSAAAALTKVGAGVTLLGYYMYHGGTNPPAAGPLHESFTGWNAYNELETKSYDYQAALGEFGQVRDTYRAMKLVHLFLHDFGVTLAPMTAYFPTERPRSLDDAITPRAALRSDGRTGFVFINNHQRNHPLRAHPDFQVRVKLAGGIVTLPQAPITLPSGVYTHWPVNLPLGAGTLRAGTAQLLCRLADPAVYVFAAQPGIPVELLLETPVGVTLEAGGARVQRVAGGVLVTEIVPGREPAVSLRDATGRTTHLLVLPLADAMNLWKLRVAGRERLLISEGALQPLADGLAVEAETVPATRVAVFPALDTAAAPVRAKTGWFTEYAPSVTPRADVLATVRQERAAGEVPPVRLNPDPKRPVALQPTDDDFARAAVWRLELPAALQAGDAPALLRIRYRGDVARVYAGDRLLTDNFYKGTPFEIGLWRLTPEERKAGLTLKVLPLRRDAPVYIPREARPTYDAHDQAVSLDAVEIVWRHEATLR
ncbi:beta-galactosidase [Opitutus sp. ER46]|uniref:beta-galactosidase n=1 Tax=Opitutus sp. ER46 TaxID=2161864 RepID=UPI000D3276AC|nr:beta-galactosidase [Opitutus sp. ER46]PTX95816.1 glycoside hydrolase family 35 [Opitutus sp. ER46]